MNPFSEKMAALTDAKLLEVLEQRSRYQPLAVEAAEAEWKRRQLSPEQLEQLQQERKAAQEEEERKTALVTALDRGISSLWSGLARGLHINRRQGGEAALQSVAVYIFLFVLADLVYSWHWIRSAWYFGEFLQVSFCIMGPAMLLTVAALLLEKKALGWTAGNFVLAALAAATCSFGLLPDLLDIDLYYAFRLGDFIYDRPLYYTFLLLAGYVFLFLLLNRKAAVDYFAVNKRRRLQWLSLPVFVSVLLLSAGFLKLLEPPSRQIESVTMAPVAAMPPAAPAGSSGEPYVIVSHHRQESTGNEFFTAWSPDTANARLTYIAEAQLAGCGPGSLILFYSDRAHTPVITDDLNMQPAGDALKYRVAVFKKDSANRVVRIGKL